MLAKLVSGIHKPDDQTVMLPCHAAAFVATLPVRAIPGQDSAGQQYSYPMKEDSNFACSGFAT
jgi:DNA polymerase iota